MNVSACGGRGDSRIGAAGFRAASCSRWGASTFWVAIFVTAACKSQAQLADGVTISDLQPSPIVAESGAVDGETSETPHDESSWFSGLPGGEWAAGAGSAFVGDRLWPLWWAQVDALMLWQGNIPSLPLVETLGGGTALDANDAQTEMGSGVRAGLVRRLGDCYSLEGTYLYAGSFDGFAQLPATGDVYRVVDVGNLPAFGDISSATLTTSALFRSAEFNVRRWNGGSINWIAGFRWVEWDERMNLDYTFENPEPYGSGNISSLTGNNLYGGQVGGDLRLWNTGGPVRVNGVAKAGVYYNHAAYQRSAASVTPAVGAVEQIGAVNTSRDAISFMGETGFNASISITRWLAWRAGYSVYWLSGVATAQQQLNASDFATSTGKVNTAGSVLLHGVTTGLEARW